MRGANNDDGSGPDDPFGFEIPPNKPTERKLETLIATALGLKPDRAGDLLGIVPSTVNGHLQDIRQEFHMKTTLEVFLYAQVRGWITFEDIDAMRARIRQWSEGNRRNR